MSTVPFRVIEPRRADDLYSAPRAEEKWAEVVATLLSGRTLFVENMTRNQLESLRTITRYRKYGVLHSKTTMVDGVMGKLLRMER